MSLRRCPVGDSPCLIPSCQPATGASGGGTLWPACPLAAPPQPDTSGPPPGLPECPAWVDGPPVEVSEGFTPWNGHEVRS